jgi:hypothetical protein
VGVAHGTAKVTLILSTRHPVPAPLQSVARRKRKTTLRFPAASGMLAKTDPVEVPVHAARPAIGLNDVVEIIPLYPLFPEKLPPAATKSTNGPPLMEISSTAPSKPLGRS